MGALNDTGYFTRTPIAREMTPEARAPHPSPFSHPVLVSPLPSVASYTHGFTCDTSAVVPAPATPDTTMPVLAHFLSR